MRSTEVDEICAILRLSIPKQRLRLCDFDVELHACLFETLSRRRAHSVYEFGNGRHALVQRALTGFDLRQIENVLDDREKMRAGIVDVAGVAGVALEFIVPEMLLGDDLRGTEDGALSGVRSS